MLLNMFLIPQVHWSYLMVFQSDITVKSAKFNLKTMGSGFIVFPSSHWNFSFLLAPLRRFSFIINHVSLLLWTDNFLENWNHLSCFFSSSFFVVIVIITNVQVFISWQQVIVQLTFWVIIGDSHQMNLSVNTVVTGSISSSLTWAYSQNVLKDHISW